MIMSKHPKENNIGELKKLFSDLAGYVCHNYNCPNRIPCSIEELNELERQLKLFRRKRIQRKNKKQISNKSQLPRS